MAKRLLITGVTGFVGGYLAAELSRAYPDALLFGTDHGSAHFQTTLPENMTLLPADLTDPAQVARVVAQSYPDAAYHLAGFASAAGSDTALIHKVNVEATLTLLRELTALGTPCRVLLASSGYVYGATKAGRPAEETDPLSAIGPYAGSKVEMERETTYYRATSGANLTITVVRSFNHTGPRQTTAFVVPAFAKQIARIEAGLEEPVVRVGNLDAIRDFIDVRDVIKAYRLLLSESVAPEPLRFVNVATGKGVTIRSLLDILVQAAEVPVTVETDSARLRPNDIPECLGNPALLTRLTGWQPEIPIEQTLTDTLNWWREQAKTV